MFHCYTDTIRGHKRPVPCSVLWSGKCMILKANIRNITAEATATVSKEKINLKVPDMFSFQDLSSFLGQEIYCFSFIKHQEPFFPLNWKNKKYKCITLKCSLDGHGHRSTKSFWWSQTLLRQSMTVDRLLFIAVTNL